MAEHTIFIELVDGIHAIPELPPEGVLQVNDFVTYLSRDGAARVVFDTNGSPFGGLPDEIRNGERRLVVNSGHFFCKCFITPAGKPEVGWAEDKPRSGGDHDVKP